MIFLGVLFVCGIIAALIGSKKGEGALGFFVGFIFGPIGILITILSRGNRQQCKNCKEIIHKKAIVCRHCQSKITVS